MAVSAYLALMPDPAQGILWAMGRIPSDEVWVLIAALMSFAVCVTFVH